MLQGRLRQFLQSPGLLAFLGHNLICLFIYRNYMESLIIAATEIETGGCLEYIPDKYFPIAPLHPLNIREVGCIQATDYLLVRILQVEDTSDCHRIWQDAKNRIVTPRLEQKRSGIGGKGLGKVGGKARLFLGQKVGIEIILVIQHFSLFRKDTDTETT